jgi:nucleotide-binding universal stress UspA family protein
MTVGIDGSSASWAALHWAAEHAERTGRRLTIVHVQTPAGAVENPAVEVFDRDLLDEAADSVVRTYPQLGVTTRLLSGDPADRLVRLSASSDVLAIGRGPHGLPALFRGSTADAVLRHAQCPVAVLPGESRVASDTIVVGAFGDDAGRAALRFAFEEAFRRGSDLLAVSRTDQLQPLCAAFPEVRARTVLTEEPPELALGREAHIAAMLVLGCRRDEETHLPRLGSLASWAVHRLDSPVVVVGHRRRRAISEPVHHAASVGVAARIPDAF